MIIDEIRKKFDENKKILIRKNSEITLLIGELLSDEACFLKININLALQMLSFIGYTKEESKDIYIELIKECSENINGKYKLFNLNG